MQTNHANQTVFLRNLPTIIVVVLLTLTSCTKDKITPDETTKKETIPNDNYYVKYVVYGTGSYGRFSNWTATTPNGTYSNSGYQTRSWNQTYGPVQKGFKCEVRIGNYIGGAPTIEISVAKNAEPFALKTTVTGASASYIIN
jgi:hypothetical protein